MRAVNAAYSVKEPRCAYRWEGLSGISSAEGDPHTAFRRAVRSCHARTGHGLLASGKASVELTHCHVQNTRAAGVEARGRSSVRLHCCRVHHSQRSGVFASAFGRLHAERCNLFGNSFAACEASAEAEAQIVSHWPPKG